MLYANSDCLSMSFSLRVREQWRNAFLSPSRFYYSSQLAPFRDNFCSSPHGEYSKDINVSASYSRRRGQHIQQVLVFLLRMLMKVKCAKPTAMIQNRSSNDWTEMTEQSRAAFFLSLADYWQVDILYESELGNEGEIEILLDLTLQSTWRRWQRQFVLDFHRQRWPDLDAITDELFSIHSQSFQAKRLVNRIALQCCSHVKHSLPVTCHCY